MAISYNRSSNLYRVDVNLAPLQFEVFLDPGFFNPLHDWAGFYHNHAAYEFQFILKHHCRLFVDKHYHDLRENSYCVIPPHTYHSQIPDKEQSVQKMSFTFNYKWLEPNNDQFHETEATALKEILDHLSFFQGEDRGSILPKLIEIKEELQRKSVGYMIVIQNLLAQILVQMLRGCPHAQPVTRNVPDIIADDERMNIIDAFFGNHYAQPVREKELADLLMVSSRQLNRILHDLYRTSFREKLLETRLKVAMDMLVHTKLSVQEIAISIGYQSVKNFHFSFKKETGTTPAQFRKQFVFSPPQSPSNQ